MRVILASSSPRRKELLSRLDIPFDIIPSDRSEPAPEDGEAPRDYALATAISKGQHVAASYSEAVILAGDTVVALNGEIYGKPGSKGEAISMLSRLAGTKHSVITAVVAICGGSMCDGIVESSVLMRSLNKDEIRKYVATGESMDKAGGYAVQGLGSLVAEVGGCYYNVVGLPLCLVADLLSTCGLELRSSASCWHTTGA